MKNICLILVGLTFLSVLPSYATKIIVNNDKDRIVYSRSSRPPKEIVTQPEYTQQKIVQNTENDNNILPDGNPKRSWIYYKSITSPDYNYSVIEFAQNMREELIGTKWNYPMDIVWPVPDELRQQYESGQNISFVRQGLPKGNAIADNQEKETQEVTYIEDERFKRTSREAADYYVVDIVKAPNTLVPSWVPEE